jgi:hypothetical protein
LEQFGFLEGRQIHEAIGVAQEALHNIKTRKLKSVVLKIDLSKAYDRVSWLYIRLLLTHLGFTVPFIRWIMCCLSTVTFSVLINGSATDFFRSERGLRQGCPLSPLLFLLVAEGLSRAIAAEKRSGSFPGINISNTLHITHLLFVDDILVFSAGTRGEADNLNNTLKLFSKATGMIINEGKSTLTTSCLSELEKRRYRLLFPFEEKTIDEGLKYLGFTLKPNDYRKEDWSWLLKKLEKRLSSWSHKWLSRAGRLVLVKSVLEAIPVFWMSLSWIPKGTLEAARKLSFRFLWSGKKDTNVTPWVRWKRIAVPKDLGGWGLKNIHVFSKALAAKGGWHLLSTKSLWTKVVIKKYIEPDSLESWIRRTQKSLKGASTIWKAVIKSFPVIEGGLAWKVGNGLRVRLGVDPWTGSEGKHLLSDHLLATLKQKGLNSLNSLADQPSTTLWAQGWKTATTLNLNTEDSTEFENYRNALFLSQIRIREQEDELVWDRNESGIYTPKEGYLQLMQDFSEAEPVWWWKKIWKINGPAKEKLFWWCVLSNKAPTWDILQKINFSDQVDAHCARLRENRHYISSLNALT